MSETLQIDEGTAHRFFSAGCFNRCWDLIDKRERTPEEDEQMLLLALASLWHWSQRPDTTAANWSIGYWQVSRVYALLGQATNARLFAEKCLQATRREEMAPFHLAYAYEALARAEMVAGDREKMETYLEQARQVADVMTDKEAQKMVRKDLGTIK